MTAPSATTDEPSAHVADVELEILRTALREVLLRIDQVRSALAANHRALDDRTLWQMLDTTDTWALLERLGALAPPQAAFTKDGD